MGGIVVGVRLGIEKGGDRGESDGEGIVEIKFRLGEENSRV